MEGEPSAVPRQWGEDFLSRDISKHVETMPDRPRVVLAIVSCNRAHSLAIASGLSEFEEAFLDVLTFRASNLHFDVFLYGLDEDLKTNATRFVAAVAALPMDEAAIYVDGKARLHLIRSAHSSQACENLSFQRENHVVIRV